MREHEINKSNNFIAGWFLDDIICDELIEYYKKSPYKTAGITSKGVNVDNNKQSTDVPVLEPIRSKYVNHLQTAVEEYIKKYPWCDKYSPWRIVESFNIQFYSPSQAYHSYHTERGSPNNNRHLVFMTYLNTVTDGGETEFYHQDLKIKPEKGLTLIWGSDWTFTHRGIPSPSQEKYIVTGWFSFI
jgi:hypothetical protein